MNQNTNKRRRITLKYKSANPLFEQWLNEWREQAKEKGSKLESTYIKAISSLKKCPIPFNSGQDCKILKGFGDHLCKLLDQRLREHKSQLDDNEGINLNNLNTQLTDTGLTTTNIKQNFVSKSYDSKEEEIKPAVKKKISKQNAGTKPNNKNKKETVQRLEFYENDKNLIYEDEPSNSLQSQATSCDEDFYILESGNFDIILYVDTSETNSASSNPLLKELNKLSNVCQFEVKKLHVGDYIWICRDKFTKKELVLPYIFERKRLDDFASSIKDGRYKEQKFRLKRSGIENKYYLIEQCQKHISFPMSSLQQAAINTAVQDGFRIKMTSNLNHTAKLLNKFSSLLTSLFQRKTLLRCAKDNLGYINLSDDLISLISFKEFNESSVKTKPLQVTDLFIKMLIQIKGMSVQKAMAITQEYPTPMLLKKAVDENNEDQFQKYLSELRYEKQKVGLSLSKIIIQLFSLKKY